MAVFELISLVPHTVLIAFIFTMIGSLIFELGKSKRRHKAQTFSSNMIDFAISSGTSFGTMCVVIATCNLTDTTLITGYSLLLGIGGYAVKDKGKELFKFLKSS